MQKQTTLFISITLLFFTVLQATAQTKQPQLSEQETKALLCHKWQAVSLTVGGKKIPMEKDDVYYLTFFVNGRFLDSQEGDINDNERWTYNHSTQTIITSNMPKKIARITDTELVLRIKNKQGVAVLTLKRVD